MPEKNQSGISLFPYIKVEESVKVYYGIDRLNTTNDPNIDLIYPLNFHCSHLDSFIYLDWLPSFSACVDTLPSFHYVRTFTLTKYGSSCPGNCNQCNSTGTCIECKPGYFVFHSKCIACYDKCEKCLDYFYDCDHCIDKQTRHSYTQNSLTIHVCSNCSIANCKICIYHWCVDCDPRFTRINNKCYDCTLDRNLFLCDPEKVRLLYVSPLLSGLQVQKRLNPGTGIFKIADFSCGDSSNLLKCEHCAKSSSNKNDFVDCFYYPDRFFQVKRLESQNLEIQKIISVKPQVQVSQNTYPRFVEIEPRNITISNCLFESINRNCLFCSNGYFLENGVCSECSEGCSKCENKSTCLSCSYRYRLVKNQASCQFITKKHSVDLNKCSEIQTKFPDSKLAQSR